MTQSMPGLLLLLRAFNFHFLKLGERKEPKSGWTKQTQLVVSRIDDKGKWHKKRGLDGRPLPLNSKRLNRVYVQAIAEVLELPTQGSMAETKQTIEDKLVDGDQESKYILKLPLRKTMMVLSLSF